MDRSPGNLCGWVVVREHADVAGAPRELATPEQPAIDCRKHEQREHGGGDNATDHDGRERALHSAPTPLAIGTKPGDATSAEDQQGERDDDEKMLARRGEVLELPSPIEPYPGALRNKIARVGARRSSPRRQVVSKIAGATLEP